MKFPGLIDIHVHLRDPGATHKEDFYTGTRAAVAGGFTFISDMPNNRLPIISIERLEDKIIRSKKAVCGIGFYYGTNGLNTDSFAQAWKNDRVFGLKLFCNHTTGEMLIEDLGLLENIFSSWESEKPILVHAEGERLAAVIGLSNLYGRRLHVCHIAKKDEVELVRQAKKKGYSVTAGVCPHYLYFTDKDVKKSGTFLMVKPPIGTDVDQDALWSGLLDGTIDNVESDHAPHTIEEKRSKTWPYGVPGLETTLGLLLKAVHDKRISLERVIDCLYTKPKSIFHIPTQPHTYVDIDISKEYTFTKDQFQTKCNWSPFSGMTGYGRIKRVVILGKICVEDGKVIV